jgi:hypothetical protein
MEQDIHAFIESLPRHVRVGVLDTYLKLGDANSKEEVTAIFDSCPENIKGPVAKLLLLIKKEEFLENRKESLQTQGKLLREDAMKILLALIPARPLEPIPSLVDQAVHAAKRIYDLC